MLKLVHVFLAVFAVGANLTYALWLRRAEREPEHLAYTIRGIRWIDRRFANPAYALLLITGLSLAVLGDIPLARGWLLASLALYLAAVVLGLFVWAPLARRQLAAVERGGAADAEYQRLRRDSARLGVVTTAIVLGILALMVTKPF